MNRLKIIDFLSGKNIWKKYQLYNKTQWYSEEEMKSFQLHKLKMLLNHCYDNVPYYHKIIEENKIDIKNIDSIDILSKFPILTKEIIQSNYKDFIPLNSKNISGIKTSQTGGTTGNILFKRTDAQVRSSTLASYFRFFDWMNIKKEDRVLRLMGGHVIKKDFKGKIKDKINGYLTNTKSLNPYDKSDENINRIISELSSNKYKLLKGYSQNLFFLSNLLKSKGSFFKIPVITTTAEPLMEEHRKAFKEVFDADTFDQYGCGEIGGIAYECNQHKGLHVAEERVILELNENNDLIITDLDNYAMPYIRYWNADQAIISKEKCSCGRKSMLIKKIMGRTCDYLSCNDGKQLHWAYFWHLLFDTNIAVNRNMKKFQVLQRTLNDVEFRIVSDMLTEEDKNILSNSIKSNLGNVNITFINVEDIENASSGKYRPVVNLTI